MLFGLWFACSSPAPTAPEPVVPPKPQAAPVVQAPDIDLSTAAPRTAVITPPSGDRPAAGMVLALSSRGDAEIERCGCPKNPAGGLARRRTLLDDWKSKGPVFAFDGGDSLNDLGMAGNSRSKSKAALILDEWRRTGIDAIALGEADWALGTAFLKEAVADAPVVAANLVCEGGTRPFPAARIVEHQGRRVGVVGLTAGSVEGCVVTPPYEAALEARSLLEGVDATVLLWPARGEAAHTAGIEGLPYDFVLDASGRLGRDDQPLWAGSTWLVGAGTMTKSIARLQVEFQPGASGFFPPGFAAQLTEDRAELDAKQQALDAELSPDDSAYKSQAAALKSRRNALENRTKAFGDGKVHVLRTALVRLTDDVADDPETQARVDAVKRTFGTGSDTSPAELIARPLVAPADAVYAGAKACAGCHAEQWTQWNHTAHARALQTLLRTQNHQDDACYGCHVTGAAQGGKPAFAILVNSPEDIGGMIQVQCEACHGPSRMHVDDPAVLPLRKPDATVCQGCHDGVRDEGRFDYATYLPKITH